MSKLQDKIGKFIKKCLLTDSQSDTNICLKDICGCSDEMVEFIQFFSKENEL